MSYYGDYDIDKSEIKDITHLYELRHMSNIFGYDEVSKILKVESKRVLKFINSDIHGNNIIIDILKSKNFEEGYNELFEEDYSKNKKHLKQDIKMIY